MCGVREDQGREEEMEAVVYMSIDDGGLATDAWVEPILSQTDDRRCVVCHGLVTDVHEMQQERQLCCYSADKAVCGVVVGEWITVTLRNIALFCFQRSELKCLKDGWKSVV